MDLPVLLVLGLWGAFAFSVVVRLTRRGVDTFGAPLTPGDRRLIGMSAFYLAAPAVVLASQLATLGAIALVGAGRGDFETWVYWGNVSPAAQLAPAVRASVALVGPVTLIAVTLSLVAWTAARPGRAASNLFRLELARVLATLTLGVHPVISILARRGDLYALRQSLNALREPAGDFAILIYACLAALAFWGWRRAHRLRALATPLHDAARAAQRRLERDPGDADAARLLGAARLASDHPEAIATIERAAQLAPEDPRVELLRGQARLRTGEARSASAHLRRAGQLFEAQEADDQSLLFEIELALTAARIALGDGEGAVMTAQAARRTDPEDPRGLLLLVDALVAGGRRDEARSELEDARGTASGMLRREIERRLRALRRR